MKLTRRQFIFGSSAAVCGLTGSYAYLYEPFRLEVTRTTINLANTLASNNLLEPLRLLHLSDLHFSSCVPLEHLARAIQLGLAEKPDIVCLTGDYISRGKDYDFRNYSEFLRTQLKDVPVFASLGNHDGGSWSSRGGYGTTAPVEECLTGAGITVLSNRAVTVTIRGNPVTLIGIADLWSGVPNPVAAWKTFDDVGQCKIVLSHNPDTKTMLLDFPWQLMLCGHTHGGQVVLPLIGAPYIPVEDAAFVGGLYNWQGRQLYITRGVGNLHGIRFNCPPEVSLLQIGHDAV